MARVEVSPIAAPIGARVSDWNFTPKDVERLNARYKRIADTWNKYAAQRLERAKDEAEDPATLDYLKKLEQFIYLRAPSLSASGSYHQSERFLMGKCRSGTLADIQETAIRTALDVIIGCADTEEWASIVGALQSGKTGVILLLAIMEPIIRSMITGLRHVPQINLTRHVDLRDQVHSDAKDISYMLDGFMLVDRKGKLHMHMCVGNMFEQLTNEPLHDFSNMIHRNLDYAYRNTNSKLDGINKGRDKLDHTDATTLFYSDECHWGNGHDSVKANHLGTYWQTHLKGQDLTLPNGQRRLIVRNFSATPFDSVDDHYQVFYHWIGPGYHGLPYFMGQKCPTLPGYVETHPEVCTYREYAGITTPLVYTAFNNYKTYLRKVRGYRNGTFKKALDEEWHKDEWAQYEDLFVEELSRVILALLKNGRTGIILRISNVNADAVRLRGRLAELIAKTRYDLSYIMYTSDEPSEDSLLARIRAQSGPVMVIVTGGVRMGCRLPARINAGIDLTYDSTTATAEQQGLFGRLCGYGGKKSLILVSEKGYDSLTYFLKNKGRIRKIASTRADLVEGRLGRPRQNIFVAKQVVETLAKESPGNQDLRRAIELFDLMDADLIKQKGTSGSIVYFRNFNASRQFKYLQELSEIVERNPQIVVDAHGKPMYEALDLLYFAGPRKKTLTCHRLNGETRAWPYLAGRVLKRLTRTPDQTWIDDGRELLEYLYSQDKGQRLQPRSIANDGTRRRDAFSPVLWINENPKHPRIHTIAVVLVSRVLQVRTRLDDWTLPNAKSLDFLKDDESEDQDVG